MTHPRDICSGCRGCYSAILKTVVKSPIIAGICMGIPTYFLLFGFLWSGYITPLYMYGNIVGPYYTIVGFTVLAWCIELASIYWVLPNLMAVCAFCHSAIGSWWLVNFFITLFIAWKYIPLNLIFIVFCGILTPAVLWHITGDILHAYTEKLIADIERIHASHIISSSKEVLVSSGPHV